ncbi:cation-transporting P-type ATPase [Jonesiaceae bacterium BS-20]|uniref:Cation-transporting P-type ATPase n=1 Tax=Jonesiaceae bacterium BS-20 TaxID=3120821 RepID=A0AAU7DZ84_9MICO
MAKLPVTTSVAPGHEISFWALSAAQALAANDSNADGLSTSQVESRLAQSGRNELPTVARDPLWKRIARQFDNILIYILLISAGLKAILGDWIDVVVIVAVTIINAAIGFIQEGKAEGSLDAIRTMLAPHATAKRDGHWVTLPATELVPGDVVRVKSGDLIPADLRLINSVNRRSSMTLHRLNYCQPPSD